MNIGVLLRFLAVPAMIVVGYGAFLVAAPWRTLSVGDYAVRQHKLTGKVEMRNGDVWTRIADDPYVEALPAEKLRYVAVSNVVWGPDGLLCARLENRTDEPMTGRLAVRLLRKEARRDQRLAIGGDRTFRINLTLPPRTPVPIVLDTNLETPDTTKVRTFLSLQPTSYSGT
ncbi:MAG: hypothetical protein SFU56_02645 [Capsulimonadales bacterium]|nr:hypothetical protein [Capsulimonadales bacterium]